MRLVCLIAAGFGALVLLAMPADAALFARGPTLVHERVRIADWRLDISRNLFSGGVACRLVARDGDAFYEAGAVGFRFRAGGDMTQAVYRLDGDAPRVVRDDLPRLTELGVPMDRGPMDDPGRGIVWVPYDVLDEASSIAIEPRADRRARTFHFRGLVALHDIAVARGCAPESRFVER